MNVTSDTGADAGLITRSGCPCCGAPVANAVPQAWSNPAAEDLPPEAHGRFLSGYASERVFFTYVRCNNCAMVYCPKYYDPDQLQRLYAHQPENMADAPFEARLQTQLGYARLLPEQVPEGGDFLEIGADIGLFAEACAARWPFRRFCLYEPNADVHDMLRQRLAGHELQISADLFAPGDLEPGSVSVAALIHVLDHIIDPAAVLEELRKTLKPGGVLFIVTHDVGSLLARLLGSRFPPYTLQHPHLFSGGTMQQFLTQAGFADIAVHKSVNHFPVTHLMQAALTVLGVKRRLVPDWPKPSLGLRLGNIATVARKPL